MKRRTKHLRICLYFTLTSTMPAAAAPQPGPRESSSAPDGVLVALRGLDQRVLTIGYRLTTGASRLCPGAFAAGFAVQSASQYAPSYRAAAARLFAVGERPSLGIVAPGSAADRADLRGGDMIVAVDGERLPIAAPGRRATFDVVQRLEATVDRLAADGALSIEIERAGARRTIALAPDRGCPTRFDVRAGGATDASANGRYVQIGSDLVQSLTSDDDLAALLAHEIAHNILGHPQLLDRIGKGLLPGLGKSGRQIRATETAADRLSLYILVLSGYRIDGAIAFWDRFTRANDWGIFSDGTHPSPEARVAALRLEAARIAGLQATGAPIVPPADLLTSTDTSADRPPAR